MFVIILFGLLDPWRQNQQAFP